MSGRGFDGSQGLGAGSDSFASQCAGGGGYGGSGNAGTSVSGGGTYGSYSQPTDLGSGGGASGTSGGRRGGGAVRLTVGGTLTVNGTVVADGAGGNNYPGAGSGGSIWITATTVAGTGTIHANGGDNNNCYLGSGAGGGGRVAVYSCAVSAPLANIYARGGSNSAASGSVYFDSTGVAVVATVLSAGNRCPGATIALHAHTIRATSFQWRRNGVPMVDGPGIGGTTYSGTSTATLTVTNVSPIDGPAEITVAVTNSCGQVVSSPPIHLICSGDFNCSGIVSVQDIFDFLNAWFIGDPRADFNSVNGLEVQDIFDFLNAWFGPC